MSKIALSPDDSGTGTFTLASPNSNTNRTLTLPDSAGELLTTTGDGSGLTGIATAAQGALAATALQAASSLNSANLTGALPAIDGSALTGVGGSTTVGTVGTYAFLGAISYFTPASPNAPGGTLSGSSLYYKDADRSSTTSPAGTWRIMGGSGDATYTQAPSVWLRIS